MTTLNIQNTKAEIEDTNIGLENPLIGSVQVAIFFDYNNTHYNFSLQPKGTYDYQVSLSLAVYKHTNYYDDFIKAVAENENLDLSDAEELVDDFFIDLSKKYEDMFETYIKKNYLIAEFNGMDANSFCNEMIRINN